MGLVPSGKRDFINLLRLHDVYMKPVYVSDTEYKAINMHFENEVARLDCSLSKL